MARAQATPSRRSLRALSFRLRKHSIRPGSVQASHSSSFTGGTLRVCDPAQDTPGRRSVYQVAGAAVGEGARHRQGEEGPPGDL
jgi:hypothetical protein